MPDTGYLDWEKNFFSLMRHCSIPYAKYIRTGWNVSSVLSTTAAVFYLLYHGDAIAPVLTPTATLFAVIPDEGGVRVGFGGATLSVIRYIYE